MRFGRVGIFRDQICEMFVEGCSVATVGRCCEESQIRQWAARIFGRDGGAVVVHCVVGGGESGFSGHRLKGAEWSGLPMSIISAAKANRQGHILGPNSSTLGILRLLPLSQCLPIGKITERLSAVLYVQILGLRMNRIYRLQLDPSGPSHPKQC